jgi:mannose-6-phosphate isomerase-like protein (cupin superfamily)
VAQITRDGDVAIVSCPPGPPQRIDGLNVGVIPYLDREAPHRGEVHPDGDELLCVASGVIEVVIDDGDEETVGVETAVLVRGGEAFVVPRGTWHRIRVLEPAFLLHVTPGPNGSYRPL